MTPNVYENLRRVVYSDGGEYDGATFVPVCPKCGRYVKSDARIICKGGTIVYEPNADCSKCGRVEMPFEGFV